MSAYDDLSRRNIAGYLDMPFLSDARMYGIRLTDLNLDETRAVLCFVLKNPDTIKAMVPTKRKRA